MNYKIKFKITNCDCEDAGHPCAQDASWTEEIQVQGASEQEAHDRAHSKMQKRYPKLHIECINCEESEVKPRNKPANVYDPAQLKNEDTAEKARKTEDSKAKGYD